MKHIVIVGAGVVGAELAGLLRRRAVDYRLTLIDVLPGLADGVALDLRHAAAIDGTDTPIKGSDNWDGVDGADVVVVTSGRARRPEDKSRDDLLLRNAEIVRQVAADAYEHAPDAVVVPVTNPVEVLCSLYLEAGFPRERVLGMGGILDSGRFRSFIAEAARVVPSLVHGAMVLGRHGDLMVPTPSCVWVEDDNGDRRPLRSVLSEEEIAEVVRRTVDGGHAIVRLLKTRSTQFGPAEAIARMVGAVLRDRPELLPVMVASNGAYGTVSGEFVGLPALIARNGLELIEGHLDLSPNEREALVRASEDVAEQRRKLSGL